MPGFDNQFICPLSQSVFTDPVIDTCGHTFEKESINQWITSNGNSAPCPLNSNVRLTLANLKPNYELKSLLVYTQALLSENEKLKSSLDANTIVNEALSQQLQQTLPSGTATATNPLDHPDSPITIAISSLLKTQQETMVAKALLGNTIKKRINSISDNYQVVKKIKRGELLTKHIAHQTEIKNKMLSMVNAIDPGKQNIELPSTDQFVQAMKDLSDAQLVQAKEYKELQQEYDDTVVKHTSLLQKNLFHWFRMNTKTEKLEAQLRILRQQQIQALKTATEEYISSTGLTLRRFGGTNFVNKISSEAQKRLDESLVLSVKNGDVGSAEELLNKGANVNAHLTGQGTPLMIACRNHNLAMWHLLKRFKVDVNLQIQDWDGSFCNSLISLCKSNVKSKGDAALLILVDLVALGVNLDIGDSSGDTALHWAGFHDHRDLVEALLLAGARADIENNAGRTAYQKVYSCINVSSVTIEQLRRGRSLY